MGPSRVTGVANEERVIDHNTVEECTNLVHPIEVQREEGCGLSIVSDLTIFQLMLRAGITKRCPRTRHK